MSSCCADLGEHGLVVLGRLPLQLTASSILSFVGTTVFGSVIGWTVGNVIDWASYKLTGQTVSSWDVVRAELARLAEASEKGVAALCDARSRLEWSTFILATQPSVDRIVYKFDLLSRLSPGDVDAAARLTDDILDSNTGVGVDLLLLHHAIVGCPFSGDNTNLLSLSAKSAGSSAAELVMRVNSIFDAIVLIELCGAILLINAFKHKGEEHLAVEFAKQLHSRLVAQTQVSRKLDIVMTQGLMVSPTPKPSTSPPKHRGSRKVHTDLTIAPDGVSFVALLSGEGNTTNMVMSPAFLATLPIPPHVVFPDTCGKPAVASFAGGLYAAAFTQQNIMTISKLNTKTGAFEVYFQTKRDSEASQTPGRDPQDDSGFISTLRQGGYPSTPEKSAETLIGNFVDHNPEQPQSETPTGGQIEAFIDGTILVSTFGHIDWKTSVIATTSNGVDWFSTELETHGVPVFTFLSSEKDVTVFPTPVEKKLLPELDSTIPESSETNIAPKLDSSQAQRKLYVVVASRGILPDGHGTALKDYSLVSIPLAVDGSISSTLDVTIRRIASVTNFETSFGVLHGRLFALEVLSSEEQEQHRHHQHLEHTALLHFTNQILAPQPSHPPANSSEPRSSGTNSGTNEPHTNEGSSNNSSETISPNSNESPTSLVTITTTPSQPAQPSPGQPLQPSLPPLCNIDVSQIHHKHKHTEEDKKWKMHLRFGTTADPYSLSCSVVCALTNDEVDTGLEGDSASGWGSVQQSIGVATLYPGGVFGVASFAGRCSPDGRVCVVSLSRPFGDVCGGEDCAQSVRLALHKERLQHSAEQQRKAQPLCSIL